MLLAHADLGYAQATQTTATPGPDAPANPYDAPAAGRVAAVEDGQTLSLADGRILRLANILAPSGDEPLADEARRALSDLALGREVRWAYAGRRMDRHGRLLAYVVDGTADAGAELFQTALLAAGLARVAAQADTRDGLADLLAAEDAARQNRRGLWSRGFYRVRTVEQLWPVMNSFQIVEGTPVEVEQLKERTYLNFGDDYATDFTLVIAARDRKLFETGPWKLEDLVGRRLRMRGWIELRGGPLIEITYPEQIEVLE